MDMGGNVGTQSSTIFIRGVVLGHIDRGNVVRRITKETVVGALIGLLIPWLVYLIGQDPAAASNPIVTTIEDVSGLLIYFGIATVLVAELGV